jgi:hypothetical protein
MITCDLKGGLGNQLFQIMATIAYCVQHKLPFIFPYSEMLNERPTYWHNLFVNIKQYTSAPINFKNSDEIRDILYQHPKYEEPSFTYSEIPKYNDIMLCGYFQSYKYFDNIQTKIHGIFDIKYKQIQSRNEFPDLLDSLNTISMHFRMGDYKHKQEFHAILPVDYYINAMNCIDSLNIVNCPCKVLVFGEQEDHEEIQDKLKYIKENINMDATFVIVDSAIPDWKQMLIMTCCEVNIIANSTFSWWGAYLNNNTKKVLYPDIWFGPSINSSTLDLFPDDWTKVSCQKIDC